MRPARQDCHLSVGPGGPGGRGPSTDGRTGVSAASVDAPHSRRVEPTAATMRAPLLRPSARSREAIAVRRALTFCARVRVRVTAATSCARDSLLSDDRRGVRASVCSAVRLTFRPGGVVARFLPPNASSSHRRSRKYDNNS